MQSFMYVNILEVRVVLGLMSILESIIILDHSSFDEQISRDFHVIPEVDHDLLVFCLINCINSNELTLGYQIYSLEIVLVVDLEIYFFLNLCYQKRRLEQLIPHSVLARAILDSRSSLLAQIFHHEEGILPGHIVNISE